MDMIKIKRQGEHSVPSWFERELKLIDPNLSPFWDGKCERWLIISPGPVSVFRQGFVTELAVSKDSGYTPLDRRILSEVKELFYLKNKMNRMKRHIEEMEESDESLVVEAEKEWQGLKREFMKKVYRFQTTETFS